jgi:hypothetical protein
MQVTTGQQDFNLKGLKEMIGGVCGNIVVLLLF